ncbi:MAG: cysteine desulfurase family protein [Candidatus Altimarinota bacterium]
MYFDHAATTPIAPEVLKSMEPWLREQFANPSSIYQPGQVARAAVDEARMTIADFLGCKPTEIFFTSSGTESCNWALRGLIERKIVDGKPIHLIVSAIEHSAVLEMAKHLEKLYSLEVTYLPVDQEGVVELKALDQALRPETALVSIMTVNNEVGTIQPIHEIGKLCKERGVYFHTDACQAAGLLDLKVDDLKVDLLTVNAGKIYGPKGVGLLYIREGVQIDPWTVGGGQEFRMRAGTENVAGIVGFGKAIELVQANRSASDRLEELRNDLWELLQKTISGIHLNGSLEKRAPNNLNIFFEGIDGENVVRRLDLMGIYVSTGSACASGTVEPSHVLLALGLSPEAAKSSLRITLGRQTTREEIQELAKKMAEVVEALRN